MEVGIEDTSVIGCQLFNERMWHSTKSTFGCDFSLNKLPLVTAVQDGTAVRDEADFVSVNKFCSTFYRNSTVPEPRRKSNFGQ